MTANEYDLTIDFADLDDAQRGAANYVLRVRDHIQVFRGGTMESFAVGEFNRDQARAVAAVLDYLDSMVMKDLVQLAGFDIPDGHQVADTINVTDIEGGRP